jgi:hypothetical protein
MSFDDMKPKSSPPPAPGGSSSPWDETPAYSGETKGFPKMSFDDLQKSSPKPASPSPWDAPVPAPPPPPAPKAPPSFDSSPALSEPQMPEPDEVSWAPSSSGSSRSASSGVNGAELTDAQVDRIARRVVELMSDQVVRNIAWEVIPDLAEMVVKERIRQLETES